jgi:hypothetical protein
MMGTIFTAFKLAKWIVLMQTALRAILLFLERGATGNPANDFEDYIFQSARAVFTRYVRIAI